MVKLRIFVVSFVDNEIEPIKIRLNDTRVTLAELVQLIVLHLPTTIRNPVVPSSSDMPEGGGSHVSLKLQYYDMISGRMVELNEKSIDHLQSGQTFIQVDRLISVHPPLSSMMEGTYLAITGRQFSLSRPVTILGHPVSITEQEESVLGTGLKTWDGAMVLAKVT